MLKHSNTILEIGCGTEVDLGPVGRCRCDPGSFRGNALTKSREHVAYHYPLYPLDQRRRQIPRSG